MTDEPIVWFDQYTGTQSVGGKGKSLSRLLQAGLPVPLGFCITVDGLLEPESFPIETSVRRLRTKTVAVRSSAIEEDARTVSFAGIFESKLNVGVDDIIRTLIRIRESASSPASMVYRARHGLSEAPRMAAIVQEFIHADASGILFVKGIPETSGAMIVEGTWGLGDGIAAGLVTPDRWLLSAEGSILSTRISDKDVAVVADNIGTKTVQVDPERRKVACLNAGRLRELASMAHRCLEIFQIPQDIEWAIECDRLWLLQSRPITAT